MNKIDEIKQTLAKANKLPWKIDSFGAVVNNNHELVQWYDGKAVVSEKEDSHLIANAPEWLQYLIGEVEAQESWKAISEAVQRENEALRKALEWYADASWTDFEYDNGDIARQALGREVNHGGD